MSHCGQPEIHGHAEGASRIVYLHGFASGPRSNKARFFRERLERSGATVQVPDLAAGDFEHLTITGQLALVREAVGNGPADLIGSSMGGYLAALFAARHNAVRRVVLLAPAFGFARRWAEQLGNEKIDQWRRAGWMEVFHYAYGEPRRLSYALLEDAAQYEDYPDFHQPARIFHGRHDDVVPSAYSVEFAASHPNACLEVLESSHELLNVLDDIGPKVEKFLLG
ncbi:MAG TPA: YqiA/YcfP family alpha/beta fold hydrolase [Bryobacteraceae bacterium]|nr:YqiA/YcfP family alpha/beta fold hydrolase [Bryobacteraceae bacterium]